ncbi:MAG TPA: hypothetical protein VGI43_16685, partial [Mucilaginibacter sp.]
MKITSYMLGLVILCSCESKNKPALKDTITNTAISPPGTLKKESQRAPITPYKVNKDYTVIDTGKYSNDGPMSGGSYAIIKDNGKLIDTIDLYYGLKELGHQTYFYHKLNHENDPTEKDSKGYLALEEGNFFLIIDHNKTSFNSLASNFDDYFSSPNVINQKIYFWQ